MKKFVKSLLIIGLLVVMSLSAPLKAHAADDLVGHWAFDETTAGSNAVDSVGGNDGIPMNSPSPSTDIPSAITFDDPRSINFNGSQYFTINRPVQNSFTICAWIKTTSVGNGNNHWNSAPIMDSEVGGLSNDFGFGVGSDGALSFGNGGTSDLTVHGSKKVNDGVWHNVCATRDQSTGTDSLYVDAQFDLSGHTSTATLNSNPYARIGWGYDGGALFVGNIDDLRVYDTALSQSQLTNLTNGSSNPDTQADNDGVPKTVEDAAPNSGDANDDGTQDSTQANVASFVDSQTNKYITLALPDACSISSVSSASGSSEAAADSGYSYPAGLTNYTADCGTSGFTATATLYFYGGVNTDLVLRKYNPNTQEYSTITSAIITHATIGGQAVTEVSYQITDGGPLDTDGTANGTIVDPVGLAEAARNSSSASVKTPDTGFGAPASTNYAAIAAIITLPVAIGSLAYGFYQLRAHAKAAKNGSV